VYPVLFHIGDFTFYSFGLLAALSIILPALLVSRPILNRQGVDPDFIYIAILGTAIGGFVGARIWYMFENWSITRADFWGTLTSGKGFTWYGGLIGGVLTVMVIARWRRVPLGLLFNTAGPALAIGYAIGRLGCLLAGDGDYGRPTTLPWGMAFPNGTVPTPPGVRVHPTPIYEILIMIVVFLVLYRMAKKPQPSWYVFGWFLVLSGAERVLVEFWRRNPVWFAGLTAAQWVSIGSIVLGATIVLVMRGRPPVTVKPESQRGARGKAKTPAGA
jgi:phosphatidylglycerol---prolipoprotein diacylglyceryl transferase